MKFILKNKGFLTSFFAGVSLVLCFAPFNFFFIGFLSISALFLTTNQQQNYKKTFLNGLIFGFGFFLFGNYWIAISLLVDANQHAWLIPFALTLIPLSLATYIALTCLSYKYLVNRLKISQNYQKILIFAFFWLFFELLRATLFSGFPWNLIGYSWLFSLKLSQLASIIGVYGLSFLAILIFLLPTLFINQTKKKTTFHHFTQLKKVDRIFFIIILSILISSLILGHYRLNYTKLIDKNYKIRLIQANIKQDLKWDPKEKFNNFIEHIKLSNQADINQVDMVVWSEASIPYAINNDPRLMTALSEATPQNGVLISGALRIEGEKYYNSIFVFDKNGVKDYYDKHHLVPFGEYVPLQKYLPFIQKITQGAEGFSKGLGAKHLNINNQITISPLVCYEAIFTSYAVDKESKKPDLLINLTNDSWFGKSLGPYQHLAMAQMRAIEYATPMIRVANSGISAYINPFGYIEKKTALNQKDFFDIDFKTLKQKTIYQKIFH